MSATLGGLIKDYRLQKNLSQLDIAFAMGWKEPSQLSRIEQGKVERPRRAMIDKLCNVMELKESEKNTLLYTGGYLPTSEEITLLQKQVTPILQNWKYPAYVLDFTWRMVALNKPALQVYEISEKDKKDILKNNPRTLSIVFDSSFTQNKYLKGQQLEDWHSFLIDKIALFKHSQKTRTKDRWYIKHVKELMAQNDLFRDLWVKAKVSEDEKGLDDYERKSLINVKNKPNMFEFHLFKNRLIQDPRFEISFHVPADKYTFDWFN
jgi:transcriptional regulator with XRE-family HTH domain